MHRLTTFFALMFAGCTLAPQHTNISVLTKDCHLSIHPAADAVKPGSLLQIDFTLENRGNRQITACRYGDSTVHFWGLEARYIRDRFGPIVDHQYCEVTMHIPPHATLVWRETVEVPNVPAGPSKVMASVRLVDPTDCDHYGCYDAFVSATAPEPLIVSSGTIR